MMLDFGTRFNPLFVRAVLFSFDLWGCSSKCAANDHWGGNYFDAK